MDVAKVFGKVLRDKRLKANLTQEELGLEADLRRTFISILERGEQQPTLATIIKLAKALNCQAHELVAEFDEVYFQTHTETLK